MALILRNAHAIDPQLNLDDIVDLRIEDGIITEVGKDLSAQGAIEKNLEGKILVPGLCDMHVHLREPGQEYKEDIESGTRAAVHGGFTAVCCMANTKPVCDDAEVVNFITERAQERGHCRVHVVGACTKGLGGETLAAMGEMVEAGVVAFSDDGRGVQDAGMMRRVMDYAVQFGKPVLSHCQDEGLVGEGQINEGIASTKMGLLGWPDEGEEIQIGRDMEISRLTNCPLHIQHITTKHGLDLVRSAKKMGVKVSCEVTPHHLFLSEDDFDQTYNTNLKVNPPLRTKEDCAALLEGVIDGSVDCWVTDHAPHALWEKDREFELAPFGMTGLETSLGLAITHLIKPGLISWNRLIELMAINPRKILGIACPAIDSGSLADLTIIDPDVEWEVRPANFESKAVNSGFIGAKLIGRATDVYVGGRAAMEDGEIVSL